jgi:hypothetical protein
MTSWPAGERRRSGVIARAQPSGTPDARANRRRAAARMTTAGAIGRVRHTIGLAIAALLAGNSLAGVPATSAVMHEATAMAPISVTAGTLNAPTGLTLSDTGGAVRVAWTAPTGGLHPQAYEIFRRGSDESYPVSPTTSAGSSPWDDSSAAECTTWTYKVRSRHTNLKSAFTSASSIKVDRAGPRVTEARIVFSGGPATVADYVRSSGGPVEVYANVTDNCAAANALTVTFDLTALGAGMPVASFGSWTPIAGGPTYNYRATFTLASGEVPNAATKSWSVTATDQGGNATGPIPGPPVTGDGAAPVFGDAEMLSAYTNFYDSALRIGEIPSDGAARTSGAYVYANFMDASGVATVTADLATGGIHSVGTAVPLLFGSYATYASGTTWPWRSAATIIDTGLPDGNRPFTVTATDKVGNPATTSLAQTVEIDDAPFTPTTASCTNAGNADNRLGPGDSTDFVLGDTIFPGSIKPGWDGTGLTATTVLQSGPGDYFDLNTDFGLTLFQGTNHDQAWTLNAPTWASGTLSYTGSTFSLTARTALRLAYQGASATNLNTSAIAAFGTAARDAAGNQVSAPFTVSCPTTPW